MDFGKALDLATNLAPILLGVFLLSLVLWTYKDARRRIDDPILVVTSVAAAIVLPVLGVFMYMMLRPPEYLDDVRERELEIRAMERTLGSQGRCPKCRTFVDGDFVACPICTTKLRELCRDCKKPLEARWAVCPYCEAEVPKSQLFDVERTPRDNKPVAAQKPVAPKTAQTETQSRSGDKTTSARPETKKPDTAKRSDTKGGDIVSEPMQPPARPKPASKESGSMKDPSATAEMAAVGKKATEQ